ncbi:putative lipoprotein [Devosia subaequoris]|uniref:Putative lipoprotein n=1 Tax=Devosia subaequoris TaxID=395930 RepID=A0A7W6ILS9_9HYPH|nr:META domain-containing protein [Devosia subaequoris]MBB4051935.1 putative lipoprotein [Devosia subaequoris]MCP1210102.1 META domain-containing protein [Devosia subaequoris]
MHLSRLIQAAAMLLMLVLSAPVMAATTLNGTVTYRERIALPADAWLRVTLVDLSTMAPVVGASAGIPAKGQVPIGFALNVHSQIGESSGAYGLLAEISSAGQVLFRTPDPVPVTIGATAPTAIMVYRTPPQPPSPEPPIPATPSDLFETLWTVTSIGGRPVAALRPPTLSIAPDHRAGGFGGCNNYFTEASTEAQALTFGPAAATRMACAPDLMNEETAYFTALSAVASYELDEQGLRLLDAAGVPLIGLVRTTE